MRVSIVTTLVLARYTLLVASIQIGRGLPKLNSLISSISSIPYTHSGYVDQKIRANAYTSLNHELWHQRNVVGTPAASSNSSNATSDITLAEAAFILPNGSSSAAATNASSTTTSLSPTDLAKIFHATKALESDTSVNWDNQTDLACTKALSAVQGVALNPSGVAACYNIRSFDNNTGAFQADLRIFRIAVPTGKWIQLVPSSATIDISYTRADLTSNASRRKREMTELNLPPIEEVEAKDMYLIRNNGAPPKMVEDLMFTGKVNSSLVSDIMNGTTIHSALVPNLTISGDTQDGTTLTTQLSTEDASFVNGLFTNYNTMHQTSSSSTSSAGDEDSFVRMGNTLAVFPIGLIITSIWALLLLMIMGYGTMSKVRARDSYRKRVKSRMSGGMMRP